VKNHILVSKPLIVFFEHSKSLPSDIMHIIIIGAGLGGLAAAYVFAEDGHTVHIFELLC
jgi:ribulose 1,5-bisphosphate synthetase/thiazole synthase